MATTSYPHLLLNEWLEMGALEAFAYLDIRGEDWNPPLYQTGIVEEPNPNRRPCMVHKKPVVCRIRYMLAFILAVYVYIANVSTASVRIENPTMEIGNGNLILEWCTEETPFYMEGSSTIIALFSNKTVLLNGTEEQNRTVLVLLLDEWHRSTIGERAQMIIEWENL